MFETIGLLFTVGFWAVAIILVVCGIIMCIAKLISGNGWEKFWAIIAALLAIVTFFLMYSWTESIAWCLLATGLMLGFVSGTVSDGEEKAPRKEKKYGISDAIIDAYVEEKVIEEAITNALRKSNK